MKEGRLGQSPPAEVRVETTMVQMGLQMKYLGLTFNGLWALTSSDWLPDWADWLMPWLASCPIFGPGAAARQGCVLAAFLYGAPVWDKEMARDARIHRCINRMQRCLVLRISKAYKTMSHAAATSPRGCSSRGSLGTTIIVDWRPSVCEGSIQLPRHWNRKCRDVLLDHRLVARASYIKPGVCRQQGREDRRFPSSGLDRERAQCPLVSNRLTRYGWVSV